MRVLGGGYVDWTELEGRLSDDEPASDGYRMFRERVRSSLVCENLMVLMGLGTTLYLNRDGREVAPTMSQLWRTVRDESTETFAGVLQKVKYGDADENIEQLLTRCQMALELESDSMLSDFVQLAEDKIAGLCRFANSESVDLQAHRDFLGRIARRPVSRPRTRIFTTNYDLCIESAAAHLQFIPIDGFSHTTPPEFDGSFFNYDIVRRLPGEAAPEYVANVFHLYKLHGSVDWQRDGARVVRSGSPDRPMIIYPRSSKFEASFEFPFLEMMSQFQTSLRQPNTALVVAGFGFADNHLARPILSAAASNVRMQLIVVDPKLPETDNQHIGRLIKLIRGGDGRILLVADTFENFATNVPDLAFPDDESELRLRARGLVN